MKKYIYKVAYPLLKMYWFFWRPKTEGVRCIILHNENALLIRHSYGSRLRTAVGGGIKPGETPEQAVYREVKEEIDVDLPEVVKIGIVENTYEYKHDTIHVFLVHVPHQEFQIDQAEIAEAKWFHKDNLPDDISPLFRQFWDMVSKVQ